MSLLPALVRAYDQFATNRKIPDWGYGRVEVDFSIVLDVRGRPLDQPMDLRTLNDKRWVGRALDVPFPLHQRTSDIAPHFLWDKSAYVLGVSTGPAKRLAREHQAFVDLHRKLLRDVSDIGASACLEFLSWWSPSHFQRLNWPSVMADANIAFAFLADGDIEFLHHRPALRELWQRWLESSEARIARCTVANKIGRVARVHPPIKGVIRTQSSGASLVSASASAFTSYGHRDGDNAQVSERAAFQSAAALNDLLKHDERKVQLGPLSTVFWAEHPNVKLAAEAEGIARSILTDVVDDPAADDTRLQSEDSRRPHKNLESGADPVRDVTLHIVALSGNVGRIAPRVVFEDTLQTLVENHQAFLEDAEPEAEGRMRPWLSVAAILHSLTPQRPDQRGRPCFDPMKLSAHLASEMLRSIVFGSPFSGVMLPTLLMRIRSDRVLGDRRVAVLRAIVTRSKRLGQPLPHYLDSELDNIERTVATRKPFRANVWSA